MTNHRAFNWLLSALIAATMSTAYLLDGPTDTHDLHTASAASLADAKAQAKRQARFERAARKVCGGENAAFEVLADGAIQCFTKRGAATIVAKVAL